MSRIAYVAGQYPPHRSAAVHIEDRGSEFADGVYEAGGHLVDEGLHLARLARSLSELRIAAPMADAALKIAMRETIRRNHVRDGRPDLPRPRAILFDWDNTLVDSWATIHEALNLTMAAMEKPLWSLDDTKQRVRLSLRESFPRHFGERWEEARQIYLDGFRAIHLDRLMALPGRGELLQGLADAGIYLGVVSNKTGSLLRREAERIGWSTLFGSVIGAGDAAVDKPDAAPVRLALAPSGIDAGEAVWLVGDTSVDMECARNAGCVPVLLGGELVEEEFIDCRPRLVFPEAAALFRFVRGL
jgi:phosphoglycolate phosphatase